MTPAEWKRKAVHAGMGLFALALRYLDWRVAALCAGAALAFNVFAMPKIGRALYRSSVPKRDTGIVAYPAMVLLLILVFGDSDLPLVAAVWAMMAFGDPAATIAGRLVGGPALPWNGDKTWVGLLADWAVAGSTSVAVFSFVIRQPPRPEPLHSIRQFGKRNFCANHLKVAVGIHALNFSAMTGDISHHVAHEFIRNGDLDVVNRFEHDWRRFKNSFLQRILAGDLE